jgi:hypothetical protein
MRRVNISPRGSELEQLDTEIARLRGLDADALRKRWQVVFGRRAPAHLPRHLLFRIIAYRIQADVLGDLDNETRRLLDHSDSPEKAGQRAVARRESKLRPGTILGREWNGRMERVTVVSGGFSWNGKTYPSLSKIAFTITGTRWNGPKFFGLRDKPRKGASP